MCKEYIEQLNNSSASRPTWHMQRSRPAGVTRSLMRSRVPFACLGFPDCRARDISIRVIKGDLTALRLPPYVPKTRFPFTPAAFQAEHNRRLRYDRARSQMLRTQNWCQRRPERGVVAGGNHDAIEGILRRDEQMAKLKDIKLVSPGKYLSKYEFSYETRDGGEKQYEMVSNNRELTAGAIGRARQVSFCWSSMRPMSTCSWASSSGWA